MRKTSFNRAIAIIDNGIYTSTFQNVDELDFNIFYTRENKGDIDPYNHGTICAAIIKKYAPTAKIGSIKVINNNNGMAHIGNLMKALNWCYEKEVGIIHMSIGSRAYADIYKIQDIVAKLNKKGTILISALANDMIFSLPACMDEVIGVKKSEILTDGQFYSIEQGLYDISYVASSRHELIDVFGNPYITPSCNSYAAPLITAKIYNMLFENARELVNFQKVDYEKQLQNTSLLRTDISIPILKMSMQLTDALKIASFLTKLEYPACVIDVSRIPEHLLEKVIAFYERKLDLSLILLHGEPSNGSVVPDIEVCIGNLQRFQKEKLTLPYGFNSRDILNAVNYLNKLQD